MSGESASAPREGYVYLASPYSHESKPVMHARYELARAATAWMLRMRLWAYSPIVHCHDIACSHALPRDFAFWRDYNFAMLRSANEMFVLAIDGWKRSKGVNGEIAFALAKGLSVSLLVPFGGNSEYQLAPFEGVELKDISASGEENANN